MTIVRVLALIVRKDGYFYTGEADIFRIYDPTFTGFPYKRVKARRKGNGVGVALILKPSPVDRDFGVPTLFITERLFWDIYEAFRVSDQLTYKLLGRGFKSIRPPDEIFME